MQGDGGLIVCWTGGAVDVPPASAEQEQKGDKE
nr:MAG TPA: hypothetical protein [Caudoviricetes sp.]